MSFSPGTPSRNDGSSTPVVGDMVALPPSAPATPVVGGYQSLPGVSQPGLNQIPSMPPLDATPPAFPQPQLSTSTSLYGDTRAPTPTGLAPPQPSFFSPNRDSVASNLDSNLGSSGTPSFVLQANPLLPQGAGTPSLAAEPSLPSDVTDEKRYGRQGKIAKWRWFLIGTIGALIVILAIVLGVVFGVVLKNRNNSAGGAGSPSQPSSGGSGPNASSAAVFGGDGTVVTMDTGKTFTYSNKFGGYFVKNSTDPFNMGARPQADSPALNETWRWGVDKVLGVNLGGWLVLEPFITPALYQKYPTAVDEWTLSQLMAADTASGGLAQLEEHYKTFVTEEDFAQIAGAGLNWVRLPIAFWAIEVWEGEPFLPKVSWTYALKAFEWARKYGLRICLDLHSTPGSQNGYNHSGQVGKINLLNGVMGVANAQRLLHYIRIITEFISQPQYKDLIPMFGIVNEPNGMPTEPLSHFYLEAYRMIRNITGVGTGNGPFISIHDSFSGGTSVWSGFLTGSDRVALEPHPYFAFDGRGSTDITSYLPSACTRFTTMMTGAQSTFGVTTAGEWSLAFNDCGLFLHTPADEHTTTGCAQWDEWENYTATQKADLLSFAMSSMDGLQHFFFWTWKISPSAAGVIRAPFWSYKLGVDNGWIPANPRMAFGHCASIDAAPTATFDGTFLPWQTGGAGAGVVNAADIAQFGAWPPPSIGLEADAAALPTYTQTGPVSTLPPQTFTAMSPGATVDAGDGWFNDADNAPGVTAVAGCVYPNPWDATAVAVPPLCTGSPSRLRKRAPMPSPL